MVRHQSSQGQKKEEGTSKAFSVLKGTVASITEMEEVLKHLDPTERLQSEKVTKKAPLTEFENTAAQRKAPAGKTKTPSSPSAFMVEKIKSSRFTESYRETTADVESVKKQLKGRRTTNLMS